MSIRLEAALAAAAVIGVFAGVAALTSGDNFDHEEHAGLFPSCLSCHRGVAEVGAESFPTAESCGTCHDGDTLEVVTWTPPDAPPSTNLTFAHDTHAEAMADSGDAPIHCVGCHEPEVAEWMTVERSVVTSCLDCHSLPGEHFEVAAVECSTCHSPLADSETLREAQIAAFSAPASHELDGYEFELHGEQVDAACAICHARDFCVQCHVDAPEQPDIAGMAPDARSLALVASVPEPPGHSNGSFMRSHPAEAAADPESCASCHTAESCTTCHMGSPQVASFLAGGGAGRSEGAMVVREAPLDHALTLFDSHGSTAASRPESCAGCHVRPDCIECHRPAAAGSTAYHPEDFLTRHPAAAYSRQSSCSDCHSPAEFCATCHLSAGLSAGDVLSSHFHDGQAEFGVGHGQAARQTLETCASCHAERDCLACHSSTGGRGINPHGPGFDAERSRQQNPQMCASCHGADAP